MKRLQVFLQALALCLRWICLGLVIGMAILVFFKVFFRYVLNDPIVWSDEVIMLMLLSLTYLGAALAAGQRKHINVDMLEALIARWGTVAVRRLRLILDVIVLIVLAVIVFYGFKISIFSRDQSTDVMMLSYLWVYLIMTVGLIFMVLMIGKRISEDHFHS
ncbi:MAG: TRAP transporter small permease subunit [Deltaproteobacteria bacterium]|nr:TRAP transporter small permease subunit [Deltaproteobacteria bacterium]